MKNNRALVKIFFVVLGFIILTVSLGRVGFEYYLSLPCPPNRPLRDNQSRLCYACDSVEKIQLNPTVNTSFKDQCAVCPNRRLDRYLGFYCVLKCLKDKPLRDYHNKCLSCDEKVPVYVGYSYKSSCDICPTRVFNHGFCFKKCPSEKPYRDSKGNCFAKEEL